jgi:hypothetical protein
VGAPTLYFDEHAAMDALRQFVGAVVPVAAVDAYRARPPASPARYLLSVVMAPTTPLPVLQSYNGEESDGAQAQVWRVTVLAVAAGNWALTVLGEQAAPYAAGGGDTPADVRDGLRAGVDALGLDVTTADDPQVAAAFTVTGDVAGASLGVLASLVPPGGQVRLEVVGDNVRRAVANWGVWTVRVVVRDVDSAGGPRTSNVGPYAEKLRLSMQATSIPVTMGLAYPYLRDRLNEAHLRWRRTLGPFNADATVDGIQTRGVALDFELDVPCVLLHDVPSLDAVSIGGGIVVGPVG